MAEGENKSDIIYLNIRRGFSARDGGVGISNHEISSGGVVFGMISIPSSTSGFCNALIKLCTIVESLLLQL